jgi:hypothetical protein
MQQGVYEGEGYAATERVGMYQHVVFIAKNGSFNIVQMMGKQQVKWGGSLTQNTEKTWAYSGDIVENGAAFTVDEDGLYFVYLDIQEGSKKIFVFKANALTLDGDGIDMTAKPAMEKKDAFSKTTGAWEATDVVIRKGKWFKIRMNTDWTYNIHEADNINAFTNLGGTLTNLTPGGKDIMVEESATYTVKLAYTFGEGFKMTLERTGDAPALQYPETLYIVGDGCKAGWSTANAMAMQPTPKAGQFWAIAYLNGTGGVQFIPTNGEDTWTGQFGNSTATTPGNFSVGSGNINVPATTGYYMVTVDLALDSISIVEPHVYGMGEAFGNDWTMATHAFTLDNTAKTFTSPAATPVNNGNLRSYAAHSWFTEWWHSEINVVGTNIVYRGTGGDPAAFPLAAGQKVVYNIDAGTAAVQ